MQSSLYVVVLTSFISSTFFGTVKSRCRRENYTEWFGRVFYDQFTDQTSEECFWNFIPPQNMSAALILKIVSFPILNGNIASQNYIRLPGGTQVDGSNLRSNLHRCKRYVRPGKMNVCSEELLDNYCRGTTIESSQWPPRMMSFSSQTSGRGRSRLFYLGFTLSYVFAPCPKPEQTLPSSTTANVITNSTESNKVSTGMPFTETAPPKNDFVKPSTMTSLVAVIGTIAVLLIVGSGIAIMILLKKLKVAKSSSSHNLILSSFGETGTYAFATDNNGGTIASTHEYATLRTIRRPTTTTEPSVIPHNGYLTMRIQGSSKKTLPYEEVAAAEKGSEPYLNENEENEREL